MLAVLTVILYALVVVVALLLIGLILIQPSKSGGLGATFGGIGESVFGAQAGSHLTKATVFLTAIFFLFTLFLATLIGHGANQANSSISGVNDALKQTSQAAVAVAPEEKDKMSEAAAPAEKVVTEKTEQVSGEAASTAEPEKK